jgi:hypothetical protein
MLLAEFLAAVFNSWIEKAGLVLTILPFIEKIPSIKRRLGEKQILDRFAPVLWLIGICCIVWGFYSAWLDQHNGVISAKAETAKKQEDLDALNKPILNGEILAVSAAPAGSHKENSFITIFLRLRNTGAPTALEFFTLSVTKQSKPVDAQLVSQFNFENLYGENKRLLMVLRPQDHISNKLSAHALERNSLADAWVQAVAYDLTREKFMTPDTVLAISFRDVATNSSHKISIPMHTQEPGGLPLDVERLSRETR